jgi:hypothetical protein
MPGTFDPNAIGFLYLRVGRPVKAALILPVALVALFCGGASESDEGSTERALWAEPVRAAAEFDRRLRGLFAYRQGFMVFVDPDPWRPTIYAVPAATPRLVACDVAGLGVGFGAGSPDAGTGVDFQITAAGLTEPQCRTSVPVAAATLAAIAKGN